MKNGKWQVKFNVPESAVEQMLEKADANEYRLNSLAFDKVTGEGHNTYVMVFEKRWKRSSTFKKGSGGFGRSAGSSSTRGSSSISTKQANLLLARMREAGCRYPDEENTPHPFRDWMATKGVNHISELPWKLMDEALAWIANWQPDTAGVATNDDDFDWSKGKDTGDF